LNLNLNVNLNPSPSDGPAAQFKFRFKWGSLALIALALPGGCRQAQVETKIDAGHEIYIERCAVCHQPNAQGVPGLYPPLAGTEWLSGPPERLEAVILDGMQGPSGNFKAVMPGWRGVLSDAEIAALATWLRKTAAMPPVTPVEVNHVRAETAGRGTFWTAGDLQALRIH
jgi:mono/diheme cytochrome c family protein